MIGLDPNKLSKSEMIDYARSLFRNWNARQKECRRLRKKVEELQADNKELRSAMWHGRP